MSFSAENIKLALQHLQHADPVLRGVIKQVGPFQMKLGRERFPMLVSSIIAQQISGSAARTIRTRLLALLAPRRVTAEAILRLTPEQLRGAGLSAQKRTYLLDLAEKVRSGQVRLRGIARRTDAEVITELTQVKGIGVWTAQMFLMFSLGRLDVFPHDDLGVRSAIRNLYGLKELPDKMASHRIAAPWRPFATVASWYCWRSLELPKRTQE